MRALLCLLAGGWLHAADFEPAQLARLHPLGGRAGTAVEIEILGMGEAVEVLGPVELREKIKNRIQNLLILYI